MQHEMKRRYRRADGSHTAMKFYSCIMTCIANYDSAGFIMELSTHIKLDVPKSIKSLIAEISQPIGALTLIHAMNTYKL